MNNPARYERDGFLSPIDIVSATDALAHRRAMESAERIFGTLHYLSKVHTILTSPFELATQAGILDVVAQLIGPDVLLYNVTYIVKEPHSPAHVSWHQDLTYWGLDSDDQVSVWLALSEASEDSGCMRMIPGSHSGGRRHHTIPADDETNVLFQSQTVMDVDEQQAVHCPLTPGQASFHHGWTLHSSMPNRSDNRRIGLNFQYIAPHVRQTKLPGFTTLLVRGSDRYRYYQDDVPARTDLDPTAMTRRDELETLHLKIAGTA